MSPTTEGESSAYGVGAGGKFRRKPLRKSQPTPYDRPPLPAIARNSSAGNGWLSKIVDPASKIITASANRLFSKMFRKLLLPPTAPVLEVNRTTEAMAMLGSKNQLKFGDQSGTGLSCKEHDVLDKSDDSQGISELEKIFAQKTFTESEMNRITALLNSRTNEVIEEKTSEAMAQKTIGDVNLNVLKPTSVPDSGINSTQHRGETSTRIFKAKVFEEDIATPAEFAKAYMGSRPSKASPSVIGSWSHTIKNDLSMTNSLLFPSQSPSTGTSVKSLSRVGTLENGFMTPRLSGRSAIYSMARTPYSREQKSPQLASEANMLLSSRKTALKRQSNVLDDDINSAGPMRKARQRPSLISSQRSNGHGGGSSPVSRPGVLSVDSKNGGSRTPSGNFMSIPSHSSIVAQQILQQLDKMSPSSKEKSSECKPVQLPKLSFSAMADMPSEQPLKSVEKVASSKIIASSHKNSKLSGSVQSGATNENGADFNGKSQLKETSPQKPTNNPMINSENSNDHSFFRNKHAVQVSGAHEDYTDVNKGYSNGSSFVAAKDKDGIIGSSLESNPQTKFDQNGTVLNESKFAKEDKFSHLSGSPTMTIQPTATDKETTVTPIFGIGAKVVNQFSPSTFTSSSPAGSHALQTSALPESKTTSLSDTHQAKTNDTEGLQRTGAMDAMPSTTSYGLSSTPALFSSGLFNSNGFANRSSPVRPVSSSAQFSGGNSASATNVLNAATEITSSGVSLFSTHAQISTSPVYENSSSRKDPQLSINANIQPSSVAETEKPISAVKNIIGNPFGGLSSATANGTNIFSSIDSSKGFSRLENQGTGTDSSNVGSASSHVKIVTTAAKSTLQNTMFQFGSYGFTAAPTSGLSGTTSITSAGIVTNLPSPIFGQNSVASSNDAVSVGSTSGSTNSLLGSNWQPNSSPLFGSTITSSMVPTSVFQFGSSATVAASVPTSSAPGLVFGSSASTVSPFSFTSASNGNSPSSVAASKPMFGSSSSAFAFGPSPSPPKISMEDSMAEDAVPASTPSTSVFGQSQPTSNSGFVFGSQSPSVTPPGTGIFQFGGQPSTAASLNQRPFQAPGSFNAGGGFSLGADDKSTRRIVKVKRAPKRR